MIASIRARLRAWWHRNVIADEEESERLSLLDIELRIREGRLP